MKEGPRVVQRNQHRLAWRALHEVVVVGRDRRDRAVRGGLHAVTARPGARPLARPGEVIQIKKPAMRASGGVREIPHAHLWMKNRHLARDLHEQLTLLAL